MARLMFVYKQCAYCVFFLGGRPLNHRIGFGISFFLGLANILSVKECCRDSHGGVIPISTS